MLLIGLSSDGTMYVIIRHLPLPDRKNWSKPSGPIVRIASADMPNCILSLIGTHFRDFEDATAPTASELEAFSPEAKAEFFRHHKFVCVEKKRDALSIIPSKVLNNSPFKIEFAPPNEGVNVVGPRDGDALTRSIAEAMEKSKN